MINAYRAKPKRAVFFDSGIGGLNLLYQCVARAPDAHYYYISDNSNVPYGNRSGEEIFALTMRALSPVRELEPDVLVIACNTVTALCIDRLRAAFDFHVIGIQPAIKQAAQSYDSCLVLATEATLGSHSYRLLASRQQTIKIVSHPCAHLARYIEDNIFNLPQILPRGLIPEGEAQCVVLGCTHYAFVKRQIENWYNCQIFDGISGTADNFAKKIGIDIHSKPPCATYKLKTQKELNITYFGANKQKNALIFDKMLHNEL